MFKELEEEGSNCGSNAYEEVDHYEEYVSCAGNLKPEGCWVHDGSDGPAGRNQTEDFTSCSFSTHSWRRPRFQHTKRLSRWHVSDYIYNSVYTHISQCDHRQCCEFSSAHMQGEIIICLFAIKQHHETEQWLFSTRQTSRPTICFICGYMPSSLILFCLLVWWCSIWNIFSTS